MEESYTVKFANRDAIQHFQEARNLVSDMMVDLPWSDDLKAIDLELTKAWNGLTFEGNDE